MAVTPSSIVTPQGVKSKTALCTVAKTNLSDTSNAVKLVAAGDNVNGARIVRVWAIGRASVGNIQLSLFRSVDVGTTLYLADSALLPSYTLSATSAIPKGKFADISEDTPMRLAPGEEVWCSIGSSLGSGVIFVAEFEVY